MAACRRIRPDVLVMDLDLPDRDGLDVIRDLNADPLAGVIVVLTERTGGNTVLDALRLGVEGYLVKGTALPRIAERIRQVVGCERVISPELVQVGVMQLGRLARQAPGGEQELANLNSPQDVTLQ